MSYTQNFNATLTVRGSVSASYPKSESGGSHSVSYSHTEHLEFVVEVDTDPVDQGVGECRTSVGALNAAVLAGAQLQIREKEAGAERVSSTVIREFNQYISGDIKQEMAQLQSQISSKQALLHAEAEAAGARKKQFQGDYQRLKERYSTLFQNLDRELERRVRALDEPLFKVVKEGFSQGTRDRSINALAGSMLSSGESDQARQSLENTGVKRRSLDLLRLAGNFLRGQKELEARIQQVLTNDETDQATVLSVPVVGLDTEDITGSNRVLHQAGGAPELSLDAERVWAQRWKAAGEDEFASLEKSFLGLVGDESESLAPRELEMLRKLWSECRPEMND